MTPIPLSLPPGAIVTGEILRDYEQVPQRLSQDILQVTLPTRVVIDVGWYPRFDPQGSFRIIVIRKGNWDDQLIPSINERGPFDVVRLVQQLAEEYAIQKSTRTITDAAACFMAPAQFIGQ